MNLSEEDVRDILRLLDTLPFDEFTLETSRLRLHLRRAGEGIWAQQEQVLAGPLPAQPPPARQRPGAAAGTASPGPAGAGLSPVTGSGQGLWEVRAPLLGTFYRAPKPGAPPFVDIGSQVEPGTVVAIIETMKLMNPVYAGGSGVVAQICLADADFAQQDAVLMRIAPEAG